MGRKETEEYIRGFLLWRVLFDVDHPWGEL
jgi:hypothetical protein